MDAIRQKLYRVEQADKKCLLQEVLQDKSLTSVLVFTNTSTGPTGGGAVKQRGNCRHGHSWQ